MFDPTDRPDAAPGTPTASPSDTDAPATPRRKPANKPTDKPADKPTGKTADTVTALLADYQPVPVAPRRYGWTVKRQRTFLTALAETGSITEASVQSGISARSAYRLRARADAAGFARAWDEALIIATNRLMTVAFERAITGTVREIWREDHLVGHTRTPNDRMLMFLLTHLMPPGRDGDRWHRHDAAVERSRRLLPMLLDKLTDNDAPMVEIQSRDFFSAPPGDPREDV